MFKLLRRSKASESKPTQVKVSNTQANEAVAAASATPLPPDQPPKNAAATADKDTQLPASPASPSDATRDGEQSVISNDDEGFLERVVSSAEEPHLPPLDDASSDTEGPSLAEAAAVEVAKKTPLPQSPPPPLDKKASPFSWAAATDTFSRLPSLRRKSQSHAAPAKPLNEPPVQGLPTKEDAQKEKKDLAQVLQRLKLDSNSMQTRALSLSEDSRKMLNQFIQILKDIVSGAPHAYDDLDDFIKNREKQIEQLFDSLPPFLQNLVKALPTKAWQYLGPQVAAGVAAATSSDKTKAQADARKHQRSKSYVPNLKSLLSNRGAVAAMLRSILEFLEARFPAALAGTNVLLSVAVFLLLFVFWYCYKRGKEERLAVEGEEAQRGRSRDRKSGEMAEQRDDDSAINTDEVKPTSSESEKTS